MSCSFYCTVLFASKAVYINLLGCRPILYFSVFPKSLHDFSRTAKIIRNENAVLLFYTPNPTNRNHGSIFWNMLKCTGWVNTMCLFTIYCVCYCILAFHLLSYVFLLFYLSFFSMYKKYELSKLFLCLCWPLVDEKCTCCEGSVNTETSGFLWRVLSMRIRDQELSIPALCHDLYIKCSIRSHKHILIRARLLLILYPKNNVFKRNQLIILIDNHILNIWPCKADTSTFIW